MTLSFSYFYCFVLTQIKLNSPSLTKSISNCFATSTLYQIIDNTFCFQLKMENLSVDENPKIIWENLFSVSAYRWNGREWIVHSMMRMKKPCDFRILANTNVCFEVSQICRAFATLCLPSMIDYDIPFVWCVVLNEYKWCYIRILSWYSVYFSVQKICVNKSTPLWRGIMIRINKHTANSTQCTFSVYFTFDINTIEIYAFSRF